MEKITKIEEWSDKLDAKDWHSFYGYKVTTDQQEIILGMDMSEGCCEQPGYFMSNDDLDAFIGATLVDVKLTDAALNEAKFNRETNGGDLYEGGVMFVDLVTDRGALQFVAYNSQNGYYGHEAVVRCKQLTVSSSL